MRVLQLKFFMNKWMNIFKIMKYENKLFETFFSMKVATVYASNDMRSTKIYFICMSYEKTVPFVLEVKFFESLIQK